MVRLLKNTVATLAAVLIMAATLVPVLTVPAAEDFLAAPFPA